ncbi:DUF2871 domain-containing protein [Micropruina sp. KQZ13P-5]|nr:DUF2871 domain-containing protein [Micropruina sp. KQZ13P-5]
MFETSCRNTWRLVVKKADLVLFRLSALWTAVGLASGLAYRELTRSSGFSGFTQLAVVHTHTLVLGTVVGLLLLVLKRVYQLGEDRRFGWFVWLWNVGLVLTAGGMAVKGTLQVIAPAVAESPALAGVSGLGHIVLTIGFVLLFLVLGRRVRHAQEPAVATASL